MQEECASQTRFKQDLVELAITSGCSKVKVSFIFNSLYNFMLVEVHIQPLGVRLTYLGHFRRKCTVYCFHTCVSL